MDIVDDYTSLYAYEKDVNPKKRLFIRQFKKNDVVAVDKLNDLIGGKRENVKTDEDWRLVEIIMQFFMQRWPEEFWEFYRTIPKIRHTRNAKGYSKTKEVKYVGAMPVRFQRLLKVAFPYQQFDKKFVNKLVKRIPLLMIGGEVS